MNVRDPVAASPAETMSDRWKNWRGSSPGRNARLVRPKATTIEVT